MGKFVITLSDDKGKLKIETSGLPVGGNLSEAEKIGIRVAALAKNFSGEAPVWRKIVNFILG